MPDVSDPNATPSLESLRAAIDGLLLADRARVTARLREPRLDADGLAELARRVAASQRVVSARRRSLAIDYPDELPVAGRRDEIAAAIRNHPVVVVCGETGSGKSTQLPKICLELGRGLFGRIGHTQPRRIAARSLATRIAAELGEEVGALIGYKVRFKDRVAPATRVKLMTDGILLAELQRDRRLLEYDTLIIDEAHERSLNIDILLGYLKRLLAERPELRVVVTSATIDPQRLAAHFGGAPIVEVAGRTYPVELRYRPPAIDGAGERDEELQRVLLEAVDELAAIDRGDILIFLSGEREIRETADRLQRHRLPLTEILPLYARLGAAEQARIFNPGGRRRIVLATNVAETSLTVPGIRHVIDAGFARISRYSPCSKIQQLPVEPISQASADQRKGRCGRVAAGVCIRLYSEESFVARRPFTEPEIQRTNLAAVILQMKLLGFGDVATFPFVDPPDRRLIKDGYRLLHEIGALDHDGRVLPLGRQLVRFPVDPRVARMVLAAVERKAAAEVLVIAAALSVQDPRERPLDRRQQADEAHALFRNEESDFLGLISLWRFLEEQRAHLSKAKFRELCRRHFLSWSRVQEWRDIHGQLRAQLHEMGFRENRAEAGYEEIHRALLAGLLSQIGFRDRDKEYLGTRGGRFHIFPGSGLFKSAPKWVVAAEIVETTRRYARGVARIDPAWAERAAGDLVKRSYSEPHWQGRRGQVAAYEKVTLFGLTLVPRRRVNFGPIDPVQSRALFIRFGLVEGDFQTRAPFWRHNRELLDEARRLEEKARRPGLVPDEEALYAFYDRHLPAEVHTTPAFERWLRAATRTTPKLLHLRREQVITPALLAAGRDFPDALAFDSVELPLRYRFEPGAADDGVTLVVPLELINQVVDGRCDWLVPGLLEERVVALLRGLPKTLRRALVPIPDFAAAIVGRLEPSDTPLVHALAAEIKRSRGLHIAETDWRPTELPAHLQMNFRLVGPDGRVVAEGRDLAALRRRHGSSGERSFQTLTASALERTGLTDWDFDRLPERIKLRRGGVEVTGYPALVDRGDRVDLAVLDSPANAARAHRAGLRRLLVLRLGRDARYLRRELTGLDRMRLHYATAPPAPEEEMVEETELEAQLVGLIIEQTFIDARPPLRDRDAFAARFAAERARLPTVAQTIVALVGEILGLFQPLHRRLAEPPPRLWAESIADMRAQLDGLVFQGFLLATPIERLRAFPRYLRGLAARLDKLASAAARDRQRLAELAPLRDAWRARVRLARGRDRADHRLDEIRWLLEELRISLFAQELGTAGRVSVKRIERRWRELGL